MSMCMCPPGLNPIIVTSRPYFFDMALPGVTDPEVRDLFTELRDEETEHLEMLQEAMAKLPPEASNKIEFDLDESPSL